MNLIMNKMKKLLILLAIVFGCNHYQEPLVVKDTDTTKVWRGTCYQEWWHYEFEISKYYYDLHWSAINDTTISGWGSHGDTIWIYYDHYKSDTMYLCPVKRPLFCDEPEEIKQLIFSWYGNFLEIDTAKPFTLKIITIDMFDEPFDTSEWDLSEISEALRIRAFCDSDSDTTKSWYMWVE